MTIEQQCLAARDASRVIATLSRDAKDGVLRAIASALRERAGEIARVNREDVDAARSAGLAEAKLKRLRLDEAGVAQLASGLEQVASLPDPVGEVTRSWDVPSGLRVRRVRIPLGVIAMIYEARPGVTLDAFALCFKAGNACVLKGGREAVRSNRLLAEIAHGVLRERGLPEAALTVITSTDREDVKSLVRMAGVIDLVIPRGGIELIRFVTEHARVPTIQHFQGVCHAYVCADADLDMAEQLIVTGKASAPATCNATECALVDAAIADVFVPRLARACAAAGVEVRGDARSCAIDPSIRSAQDADFGHEFLGMVLALRVVDGLDDAIAHIEQYASDHTETIITRDERVAREFQRRVRSSCVLWNASTRFNDGFQLGLGAEIGISTSRLHAYGPMGLESLTIERFVVDGDGQTR
ncbi:MAG: glutamate-5-semialdehyde dehydrogenase [Phycisphaerales bacterium]|nr:glutamate-5-semialdehyde dehydrogenase [Phycisphaerales bacterium]